jgi:hypothetical protein
VTDFELPVKRAEAPTRVEARPAPAVVVEGSVGSQPIRRSIGSTPSGLSVGPADDAFEREADAVAVRAVRSLRSGLVDSAERADVAPGPRRAQRFDRPPTETAGDDTATRRIQRSALTISQVDRTPTIRRKLGNTGTPLVGRKVRKVGDADPNNVGTIESWSGGGGMWNLSAAIGLSSVVYAVRFTSGVQQISATDEAYELVPVDSAPSPSDAKTSTTTTATPSPDTSKHAETIVALDALIERLKTPLLNLPGASAADHKARKNLLDSLLGKRKEADIVLDSDALAKLEKKTTEVELDFRKDIAAKTLDRENRAKAKEAEEQRLANEKLGEQRIDKIRDANKERCGKSYAQFDRRVPDPVELADLLRRTQRSDDGQLLTCLENCPPGDVVKLFEAGITPKPANELLRLIPDRPVEQLLAVHAHIQPGELPKLADLLRRTAPDKAVLIALLTKLGNSATAALAVMANATQGSEASVLAMLEGGRTAKDTASLLDTTSGRTDTAGAATISAGVADVNTARILLDQPGVSGNAAQALQVLAHQLVGNDIAKATQLLNKQGNAADALALLGHGCTLADAGQLLATPGIVGHGADAVWCLAQGCTHADLVALLAVRSAKEIRSYHAAGHAFEFVKRELAKTPGQQFWAGERCAAPSFSGPETSIADIIDHAVRPPPAVGDYSGGNRFWNSGGLDADGNPVMFLPPGTYREYDLKPFSTPAARGTRRIVVDGAVMYYTDDHYRTFKRFA